ncbi:MAG TPA: contact-dependent growth inhibition system immunity protein [Pseudacidobacterium sp.]|nr:contact-dependent growth inhibition system immunity protein [Pseudacidobacterium sp.]
MVVPYVEQYPYLFNLIGGWFHQDFALEGDTTLEGIIAAFRKESPPEDWLGTRADIHRLLRFYNDEELPQKFGELFSHQVDAALWGMTTRQWLLRIDELLK